MTEPKKKGVWTREELALAVSAYQKKECGLNECARIYNIPKATLKRHVDCKNKIANGEIKFYGGTPTFSVDIENEIKSHILKLEEMMFGLTQLDVRKLAFDVAEKNGMAHSFNRQKGVAGKKWYYNFMKRHPDLSLRTPECTSLARARGFNRASVSKFFDLLENICDRNALDGTRVFNVDESGFSTVQKRCQKIVATKGKKQIAGLSSGERGVNTTAVCCCSAAGQFVPPMIIFKRKRMAPELKIGAPEGSLVEISESGYIDSSLFVKWLQFFVDTVHPSQERKVLLCLDGHTTHSKNLQALELARESGVIMLQLPAHTTHKLQPLDVTFFKPLETFYIQEMQKWMRANPNASVSMFNVASILAPAYRRAATIENAASGFRSTGIWPVNRDIFGEHEFTAAENLSAMEVAEEEAGQNETGKSTPVQGTSQGRPRLFSFYILFTYLLPLAAAPEEINTTLSRSNNSSRISVAEISPVPAPTTKSRKRRRVAQQACELTSSPYKNELAERKARTTKPNAIFGKNEQKSCNTQSSAKTADPCCSRVSSSKSKPSRNESWFCILCKDDMQLDMIQCQECNKWVHAICANVSPLRKFYFCPHCLECF